MPVVKGGAGPDEPFHHPLLVEDRQVDDYRRRAELEIRGDPGPCGPARPPPHRQHQPVPVRPAPGEEVENNDYVVRAASVAVVGEGSRQPRDLRGRDAGTVNSVGRSVGAPPLPPQVRSAPMGAAGGRWAGSGGCRPDPPTDSVRFRGDHPLVLSSAYPHRHEGPCPPPPPGRPAFRFLPLPALALLRPAPLPVAPVSP